MRFAHSGCCGLPTIFWMILCPLLKKGDKK
jgi:hypothetical protein